LEEYVALRKQEILEELSQTYWELSRPRGVESCISDLQPSVPDMPYPGNIDSRAVFLSQIGFVCTKEFAGFQ